MRFELIHISDKRFKEYFYEMSKKTYDKYSRVEEMKDLDIFYRHIKDNPNFYLFYTKEELELNLNFQGILANEFGLNSIAEPRNLIFEPHEIKKITIKDKFIYLFGFYSPIFNKNSITLIGSKDINKEINKKIRKTKLISLQNSFE